MEDHNSNYPVNVAKNHPNIPADKCEFHINEQEKLVPALNSIMKEPYSQNENKDKIISEMIKMNKELTFKNEQKETREKALLTDIAKLEKIEKNSLGLKEAGNITTSEGLESIMVELAEQLVMSVKELESFFYEVAHNLQAPIGIISDYSIFLKEDYSHLLDEGGHENINIIIYNMKQIGRLIDNLLQFLQLRRLVAERSVLDIHKLLRLLIKEKRRYPKLKIAR